MIEYSRIMLPGYVFLAGYRISSPFAEYINFSFLIGGDGSIFEGRGWNVQVHIISKPKFNKFVDVVSKHGDGGENLNIILLVS